MTSDEVVLDGLEEPAEILIDRWGVPHVHAGTLDDVFRVQGFNAARDRLWQMDFWRRRGLGRLAEAFGPTLAETDRASRLFVYRGDMRAEWLAYGSDTKRVATAYVEGVNAFVRMALDDPALLPEEFKLLGYQPALWDPEDVARIRSNGLYYNLDQEVARALVLRDFPPEVEELRRRREPPVPLTVPDGLDLSLIPDDVLRVYRMAIDPPPLAGAAATVHHPDGSNNWVLAPHRTTTGRPLLANDPHRALSVPSLRYLLHLSGPGLDVIGAGEPALPGISIGHNGQIAFGLTIFSIDQEDLYVYETNPDDPLEYRYQDRWEPMRVVTETIPVRGEGTTGIELRYTRHGPVIYEDPSRHTAFAVRAAWLEPGAAPYLGSMDYMRAPDTDRFLAAMNRWETPPENQVFADPAGTIGWKPAGLTPVRPNWDGTLPVPGDGRYEWAGFRDMDELPEAVDPERGWLATANEMNLPPGFPPEKVVSHDWYAPTRAERLAEVFVGDRRFSPEDCVRLQSDFVSLPARRIVARLAAAEPKDGPGAEGHALLTGWDGDLATDSGAAALFEVWYRRHLRPALLRQALEQIVPDRVEAALVAVMPEESLLADSRVDLDLVERPGDWLGPDADAVLDRIMLDTLAGAMAEIERLLGPDRDGWAWGRLHTARLAHPLSPLLDEADRARFAIGPAPRGGSGDTVGNTAYLPETFVQAGGSTFRIVVDVGDWDGSLVMNSPGQSGDRDSPHYDDLFEPWARGEAFPLLYSREKVEEATERRIRLRPPG